jgi:hypothetical protein
MPALLRIVDPLGLVPRATGLAGRAAIGTLERVVASPRTEEALELVMRSRLPEQAVRAAIDQQLVERIATEVLQTETVDRLVAEVLDSDRIERIVVQVLESHVFDASVARVLASEQLWLVVEEIAQSPAVTDAIAHQGVGFADQVAGEVAERSRRADDRLESAARRLLRRRPKPPAAHPPFAEPRPT